MKETPLNVSGVSEFMRLAFYSQFDILFNSIECCKLSAAVNAYIPIHTKRKAA